MDKEQERLITGLVLYCVGAVYCGVAFYWYTKGYVSKGVEKAEAAANAEA